MEIWRNIEGYDGKYQVSNKGRVKSLRDRGVTREKMMSLQNNGTGYLQVGLSLNGICKIYLVHRLVATAFIDNPNNYDFVNHKDENKKNNNVENLEWCTKSYNSIYYLNKVPERKKEYARRFIDKKTGKSLSPYCKKNVVHTNNRKVAQKSISGDLVNVFDNVIDAHLKTGMSYQGILRACRLNESSKPKQHKRVCDKYVCKGFIWEYINDVQE